MRVCDAGVNMLFKMIERKPYKFAPALQCLLSIQWHQALSVLLTGPVRDAAEQYHSLSVF